MTADEIRNQRVLVFGGRKYRNYQLLFRALDRLEPSTVIHGDAPGADTGADVWAVVHGYTPGTTLLRFPAYWRPDGVYDKDAGTKRNARQLAEGKPELGLQFPGGTGTADMRRRLDDAGILVMEIKK